MTRDEKLAACVEYSFWQCYDSGIEILRDCEDRCMDEDQLEELKSLVDLYGTLNAAVGYRAIPMSIVDKITAATTLDECYE